MRETTDARSFVFDVPAELSSTFAYCPGQFVTVRVVIDGVPYLRSYSMSSAQAVGDHMQVTVKRVPGGLVSNWLNDHVGEGSVIEVRRPAGAFVLGETDREIVAFAAGSGITPIFSILKSALATTGRRVRLLYANRDRKSVIFGEGLAALASCYPDRLRVTHHRDDERGQLTDCDVAAFVRDADDAEFYLCGPPAFIDAVEHALIGHGVSPDLVHCERFATDAVRDEPTYAGSAVAPAGIELTLELGSRSAVVAPRPGATILQSARAAGLQPPSSCETGTCATCLGRVVEGRADMRNNEVLTPDEVTAGWVLTCQAVPVSPRVHVIYD